MTSAQPNIFESLTQLEDTEEEVILVPCGVRNSSKEQPSFLAALRTQLKKGTVILKQREENRVLFEISKKEGINPLDSRLEDMESFKDIEVVRRC
jgi:hypothetical protein